MSRSIFWLLLMVLLTGLEAFAQKAEIPNGWQRVTACQFTFILPGDLQNIRNSMQASDFCFAVYDNKDMIVSLDYGSHISPMHQEWENDYKSSPIKLNGKKATLITFVFDSKQKSEHPFVTEVHLIRKISKKNSPLTTTSLLFMISTNDAAKPETIDKIVKSIKFVGGPVPI